MAECACQMLANPATQGKAYAINSIEVGPQYPCATWVQGECEKELVWFCDVAHHLSNKMFSVPVVRFRTILFYFLNYFLGCVYVFRGRAPGRTRASGKLCLQTPTSNS